MAGVEEGRARGQKARGTGAEEPERTSRAVATVKRGPAVGLAVSVAAVLVLGAALVTSLTRTDRKAVPFRAGTARTFDVVVHWSKVPAVNGYRVYRGSVLGRESTLLGSVPPSQDWFVDPRLPARATGTWFYRVRSVRGALVSEKSAPMVVDARGIPTDARAG